MDCRFELEFSCAFTDDSTAVPWLLVGNFGDWDIGGVARTIFGRSASMSQIFEELGTDV